jgi:hypothetical protein
VTRATVFRAGDFATSIDAIGEVSPDLKAAILAGDVDASAADLETMAKAGKRRIELVAKAVANGDRKAIKDAVKAIEELAADEAAADLTAEQECEAHNKAIESFCRGLLKYFKDNTPTLPYVTEGVINSARANLKACCDTRRANLLLAGSLLVTQANKASLFAEVDDFRDRLFQQARMSSLESKLASKRRARIGSVSGCECRTAGRASRLSRVRSSDGQGSLAYSISTTLPDAETSTSRIFPFGILPRISNTSSPFTLILRALSNLTVGNAFSATFTSEGSTSEIGTDSLIVGVPPQPAANNRISSIA